MHRKFLGCVGWIFLLFFSAIPTIAHQTAVSIPSSIVPSPRVEYALPYPGLLPDHPLYRIKKLRDWILLVFTRDPERKSQLLVLVSDKKLMMTQVLWDKQNRTLSLSILAEAEEHFLASVALLQDLKRDNLLPVGIADKMEVAARKHQEVIHGLWHQASEEEQLMLEENLVKSHQAMGNISVLKS